MRGVLPVLFVAAAIVTPAQEVSRLDQPVTHALAVANPSLTPPCHFWRTLEQAARQMRVRVGLESLPSCHPSGSGLYTGDDALEFRSATPRAVFSRIVELRPEYRWREIDGVVVVRPAAAWASRDHLLGRHVAPFVVEQTHPHLALHAMLEAGRPPMFYPHTDVWLSSVGARFFDVNAMGAIDHPIDVMFRGGTLLDALNAVSEPFDGIWQVGYSGAFAHIVLQTPDFEQGSTIISLRAGWQHDRAEVTVLRYRSPP